MASNTITYLMEIGKPLELAVMDGGRPIDLSKYQVVMRDDSIATFTDGVITPLKASSTFLDLIGENERIGVFIVIEDPLLLKARREHAYRVEATIHEGGAPRREIELFAVPTFDIIPGAATILPFIVMNSGTAEDVVALTAGLPAGYSIDFFHDLDGNGQADPLAEGLEGKTITLGKGIQAVVLAVITAPANATANQTVSLKADSRRSPATKTQINLKTTFSDLRNLAATVNNLNQTVTISWDAPDATERMYDVLIVNDQEQEIVPYDVFPSTELAVSKTYNLGDIPSGGYGVKVRISPYGEWRFVPFVYIQSQPYAGQDYIENLVVTDLKTDTLAVTWKTPMADQRIYTMDLLSENDNVLATVDVDQAGSLHKATWGLPTLPAGTYRVRISATFGGQSKLKISAPFNFVPAVFDVALTQDPERGLIVSWKANDAARQRSYQVAIIDNEGGLVATPVNTAAKALNVAVEVPMGSTVTGDYIAQVRLMPRGEWVTKSFHYLDYRPQDLAVTMIKHSVDGIAPNDLAIRASVPSPGIEDLGNLVEGMIARLQWTPDPAVTEGQVKYAFQVHEEIMAPDGAVNFFLMSPDPTYDLWSPADPAYRNIVMYVSDGEITKGRRTGRYTITVRTPGALPVVSPVFEYTIDGDDGQVLVPPTTTTTTTEAPGQDDILDNPDPGGPVVTVKTNDPAKALIIQIGLTFFKDVPVYTFEINGQTVQQPYIGFIQPFQTISLSVGGYDYNLTMGGSIPGSIPDVTTMPPIYLGPRPSLTPAPTYVQTSRNAGAEILSLDGEKIVDGTYALKLFQTAIRQDGKILSRGDFKWTYGDDEQTFSTGVYSTWPKGEIMQLGDIESKYGLVTFRILDTPPATNSVADPVIVSNGTPPVVDHSTRIETTWAGKQIAVTWFNIDITSEIYVDQVNQPMESRYQKPNMLSLVLSAGGQTKVVGLPLMSSGYKTVTIPDLWFDQFSGVNIQLNAVYSVWTNSGSMPRLSKYVTFPDLQPMFSGNNAYVQSAQAVNTTTGTLEGKAYVESPVQPLMGMRMAMADGGGSRFTENKQLFGFVDEASNATEYDRIVFLDTDGKPRLWVNDEGGKTTTSEVAALPYDTEVMLTAVIDKDALTARLLWDGYEIASMPISAGYAANAGLKLVVGGESPIAGSFTGGIRDVRYWNVARTPAEVQSTRDVVSGEEVGLVLAWKLKDDANGTFVDKTPNGIVGILSGSLGWREIVPQPPASTTTTTPPPPELVFDIDTSMPGFAIVKYSSTNDNGTTYGGSPVTSRHIRQWKDPYHTRSFRNWFAPDYWVSAFSAVGDPHDLIMKVSTQDAGEFEVTRKQVVPNNSGGPLFTNQTITQDGTDIVIEFDTPYDGPWKFNVYSNDAGFYYFKVFDVDLPAGSHRRIVIPMEGDARVQFGTSYRFNITMHDIGNFEQNIVYQEPVETNFRARQFDDVVGVFWDNLNRAMTPDGSQAESILIRRTHDGVTEDSGIQIIGDLDGHKAYYDQKEGLNTFTLHAYKNGLGEGPAQGEVSINVLPINTDTPGITASVDGGNVVLNWDPIDLHLEGWMQDDASTKTSYVRIDKVLNGQTESFYVTVTDDVGATTYTFNGLPPGAYVFKVSEWHGLTQRLINVEVVETTTTTTTPAPPAAPTWTLYSGPTWNATEQKYGYEVRFLTNCLIGDVLHVVDSELNELATFTITEPGTPTLPFLLPAGISETIQGYLVRDSVASIFADPIVLNVPAAP